MTTHLVKRREDGHSTWHTTFGDSSVVVVDRRGHWLRRYVAAFGLDVSDILVKRL